MRWLNCQIVVSFMVIYIAASLSVVHENLTFLLLLFVRAIMHILRNIVVSTTLWVGNLGEFVTDDVLSQTFQQASTLRFVPACVVRKPNMESLRYGLLPSAVRKRKM